MQGCKATELATELATREDLTSIYEDFDLPVLLEEMINDGMLVEIEYVLPAMNYRAKSFLLPPNAEVRVTGR